MLGIDDINTLSVTSKQMCKDIYKYVTQRNGSSGVYIALIVYICTFATLQAMDGLQALVPYLVALLPAFLILIKLIYGSNDPPMKSMVAEFFVFGAVISISIATILELVSNIITKNIWISVMGGTKSVSITVELFFIFIVIVTVGGSEEFAKYISMNRAKFTEKQLPKEGKWFFRLLDSPSKFVICACASGAGFATVENIKYVFQITGSSDWLDLTEVAVLRGLLAVPFHICCTGLVALYAVPQLWICDNANHNVKEGTIDIPLISNETSNEKSFMMAELSWSQYISNLTPSILLHGLYDSALMLSNRMPMAPHMPPFKYHKNSFLKHIQGLGAKTEHDVMVEKAMTSNEIIWMVCCLCSALIMNVTAVVTFILKWKRMKSFEKRILPEILNARQNSATLFIERMRNMPLEV